MMLTNLLSQLSEKKFGGVTVSVHRVNRRARRSRHVGPTQSISIRLKMQRQHLKLLILGLGCGKSVRIASLKEGQVVLVSWFGAASIVFLPLGAVGKTGRVNGVDMTHEMLKQSTRKRAKEQIYKRSVSGWAKSKRCLWADNSVDVIISNCVINFLRKSSGYSN